MYFFQIFFFWGGSMYVACRISVLLPDIEAGPQPGILTSRPPGNFLFQIIIANKYFYQIKKNQHCTLRSTSHEQFREEEGITNFPETISKRAWLVFASPLGPFSLWAARGIQRVLGYPLALLFDVLPWQWWHTGFHLFLDLGGSRQVTTALRRAFLLCFIFWYCIFFYLYRALYLSCVIFSHPCREKKKVNQGFWHVSFSSREHKVALPASLIKHKIYGRPFIYIQLKCSLLGDWECMETIIWKGLTLRTGYRGSNVVSAPLPFHRTPVHYALHRGDSSRFYKYLPVAL